MIGTGRSLSLCEATVILFKQKRLHGPYKEIRQAFKSAKASQLPGLVGACKNCFQIGTTFLVVFLLHGRQIKSRGEQFAHLLANDQFITNIRVLLCYIECTIHNPQEPHNYVGPTMYVALVGCVWYIDCQRLPKRVLLCYIECTIHNQQEPHNYVGPTIYVALVGCVWYIDCNIEAVKNQKLK